MSRYDFSILAEFGSGLGRGLAGENILISGCTDVALWLTSGQIVDEVWPGSVTNLGPCRCGTVVEVK